MADAHLFYQGMHYQGDDRGVGRIVFGVVDQGDHGRVVQVVDVQGDFILGKHKEHFLGTYLFKGIGQATFDSGSLLFRFDAMDKGTGHAAGSQIGFQEGHQFFGAYGLEQCNDMGKGTELRIGRFHLPNHTTQQTLDCIGEELITTVVLG